MEEQPVPDDTTCPECGSPPTHETQVKHHLHLTGYRVDDIELICGECDNRWMCGVPIGEFEGGTDLWCSSCDSCWVRIHELDMGSWDGEELRVHTKCPNCNHFDTIKRPVGPKGMILIGYPDITGSTEGTTPIGHPVHDE